MIRTSHQSRQMFKDKLILKWIVNVLVVIHIFRVKPYKYSIGEEEDNWFFYLFLLL